MLQAPNNTPLASSSSTDILGNGNSSGWTWAKMFRTDGAFVLGSVIWKTVLLPCAVGEGERQGIVPQHGQDGHVAVGNTGFVVGHVEDAGPGEPEPAIDLR